jgi:hypothetical protein
VAVKICFAAKVPSAPKFDLRTLQARVKIV